MPRAAIQKTTQTVFVRDLPEPVALSVARAHRRQAGAKSARRVRVQPRWQRDALGQAEAETRRITRRPGQRSGRRTTNLRHVVVTDGGRVAVVPIYGDAAP